ncbi:unnamed protein product [Closterium sp. Yama58-4]|nr:unnamed protein product [Closterium sp. Yama58-4]
MQREVCMCHAESPAATSGECGELRSMRREAYAAMLKECQLVDPVIGSGFVVDFPRVQDDGTEVDLPDSYTGPLRLVPPIPPLDTAWEETGAQLGVLEEGEEEGEGEEEEEEGEVEGGTSDSGRGGRRHAGGSGSGSGGGGGRKRRGRRASETAVDEAMRTWAAERAEVVARVGLDRIHKWRHGLYQIGVDVTRADRSLLFFESSRSRARLMNVLAVYAWFDPEVGYCQGMSDLMSPMVVLYQDDADAFWAFERLMRRVREDFMNTDTGLGIQREISRLSHMVYTLDPELHAHLDLAFRGSDLLLRGLNPPSRGHNPPSRGLNPPSRGLRPLSRGLNPPSRRHPSLTPSVADGQHTVADGQQAVADGQKAVADGQKAVADGQQAVADGQQAVADG